MKHRGLALLDWQEQPHWDNIMRGGTLANTLGKHTAEPLPHNRECVDGTAYMTYFDHETGLGFEWPGPGYAIEVSQGGLGEPIQWILGPDPLVLTDVLSVKDPTWLWAWYATACRDWIRFEDSKINGVLYTTRVLEA